MGPDTLIGYLWLGFAAVWLVAARGASSAVRSESILSGLLSRVPLLLAALLLVSKTGEIGWLATRLLPHSPAVGWTGAAIVLAGVALAILARLFLGRNWSGIVTVKRDHELILRGPYRFVRHPIYSGILLALLGTAVAVGQVRGLIALAFAALGLRWKSLKEEQFMEEEFGDAYRSYKQRVKALIPLVW